MRVGPRLAPFTNSRSPLTLSTQSRMATCRSPVRTWRASLDLVGRRPPPPSPSRSGWAPSAHGHQRSGFSTPNGPLDAVRAGGQRLLALALDRRRRRWCGCAPRAASVAVDLGPHHDLGPGVVGVGAQHPQAADAHRAAASRSAPAATARPGSSRGRGSPSAGRCPVTLRLAVRSAGGVHVTSTARACSGARRARSVISNSWGKK